MNLLVDAADALQVADVERVLGAAIARVVRRAARRYRLPTPDRDSQL